MFNIGDWIYDLFGPYGAWGILLCIFLIFLIDAIAFPTLPELFFVIGFMYNPSIEFGLQLLMVAIVAEIIGISTLYWIVEHVRVPERIKNIAEKYVKFLIVSDERMLLVNRAAPMIPFAGAFISIIESWRLSKAMMYIVLGCVLKYGLIMLMSNFFFTYFSSGEAQTYTILFVIVLIVISLIFAYFKKKGSGLTNESC
jgi:hypothetical protein